MDGQRRDRLRRMVSERARVPGGRDWARAVCDVCVQVLAGIDAAALTLRGDSGAQELLGASGSWAADLEEAQYTLGEGPGVEAFATGGPVLVADLAAERPRWPGFAAAGPAAELAAVFAFPLRVGGIRLGTLTMYRRSPGGLAPARVVDAALLADLATLTLLARVERAGPDGVASAVSYAEVNVATGMLAAQLRIGLEEAFTRLRAHAFAEGRSVLDTARDVMARRIPPELLTD